MKFVKRPPDRLVLNGEEWFFHYGYDGKNGKHGTCAFSCATPGRERTIVFFSGRARQLEGEMMSGFRVASGTPERGFATALRRRGYVTLEAADSSNPLMDDPVAQALSSSDGRPASRSRPTSGPSRVT